MLRPTTIVSPPATLGLNPKEVVLTFDDGPNHDDSTTTDLLDVLDRWQVQASFCVIGSQAERSPATIRRIHDSGHSLVNHSQTHPWPWPTTKRKWLAEIDTCDGVLGRIIADPQWTAPAFRPPYGLLTSQLARALQERQKRVAGISYYAFDTYCSLQNYGRVVDRIVQNAKTQNGGAYVLHDFRYRRGPSRRWQRPHSKANRSWVPIAVDQIIRDLTDAGMTFRREACSEGSTV